MNLLNNKLSDYIAGRVSLSEFVVWFVPTYWNIDSINEKELSQIVYKIELELAEYTYGHWTEDELKEHLNTVVRGMVPHEEKEN